MALRAREVDENRTSSCITCTIGPFSEEYRRDRARPCPPGGGMREPDGQETELPGTLGQGQALSLRYWGSLFLNGLGFPFFEWCCPQGYCRVTVSISASSFTEKCNESECKRKLYLFSR